MQFLKKYSWLQQALLFTLALLAVRMVYTRSLVFLFIPWNLFLAALPLWFAYRLNITDRKGPAAWLLLCMWLLFFPNSMYIVTDLFHLKQRRHIPMWYDLLILVSAAMSGIIMGFVSLRQVERFLLRRMHARYLPWLILCFFIMCGYGIYIGRYLRWNSWDLVTQPGDLLRDMTYHVMHPYRSRECWMLTVLFGVWMHMLYRFFRRSGWADDKNVTPEAPLQ